MLHLIHVLPVQIRERQRERERETAGGFIISLSLSLSLPPLPPLFPSNTQANAQKVSLFFWCWRWQAWNTDLWHYENRAELQVWRASHQEKKSAFPEIVLDSLHRERERRRRRRRRRKRKRTRRENRHVWGGPGWSPRQPFFRRHSWFILCTPHVHTQMYAHTHMHTRTDTHASCWHAHWRTDWWELSTPLGARIPHIFLTKHYHHQTI